MKKILSIVAVLALVLSLGAVAFAAPGDATPSIKADKEAARSIKEATVTGADGKAITIKEDGKDVTLEADVSEANLSAYQEAQLLEDAKAAAKFGGFELSKDKDAAAIEVVDITLVDAKGNDKTDVYAEQYGKDAVAKVAFVKDGANKVAAVLYWNDEKGQWDNAKFSVDAKTNKITVDLEHFCPVALVMKDVKAGAAGAPAGNGGAAAPAGNGGAGAPAGGPGTSPQTGYNTGVWTIVAVAMALCAGYCFVARKKVTE